MSASIPLKRCTKCHEEKPATPEFFKRNKCCKDGLHTQCKVCTSAHGRQYWSENADILNERRRADYPNHRQRNIEYHRWWRENHRDIYLAGKKRWYEENREYDLAKSREWREKNPEYKKEYDREYGKRNRPRIKIRQREWEIKNKERLLIQRRPKKRLYENIRRTRKDGLPNTFTQKHWEQAIEYFDGRCAICARPPGLWHILAMDHWIPLSSLDCPGTIPTNIVPLCHGDGGCNNSKHDKFAEEWLVSKFGKRKAVKIMKRIEQYFIWVKERDSFV